MSCAVHPSETGFGCAGCMYNARLSRQGPFLNGPPSYVAPSIGWVCSKCGRSYAPFVAECTSCNKQEAQP